jgi:predicted PurR-regulated permease PerM
MGPRPLLYGSGMQNLTLGDARLTTALKVLAVVVLAALVLVGFLQLLGRIHTVTVIVIGAVFLCYVVLPAVRRLNTRLPLWASITIVYAVVIVCVGVALAFIVPLVGDNVRQFVQDAPAIAQNAQATLADPTSPIGSHLTPGLRDYIAALPTELVTLADRYGGEATKSFLGVVMSAVSILVLFVIVPVVAIYLMVDSDKLYRGTVSLFPPPARPKAVAIIDGINAVLGGFIRGQLLVAIVVGTLIAIMLTLLHVRFAILIGVIAGVLNVIPYVGAFAGAAPAVLIALFTNSPINALFVIIGFVIINQLEGHVIAPLVVGQSVGLSPLAVILALLTFGELFGLLGLLIAVPVAGIIKVLVVNLVPRYALPEPQPALAPTPAPTPTPTPAATPKTDT